MKEQYLNNMKQTQSLKWVKRADRAITMFVKWARSEDEKAAAAGDPLRIRWSQVTPIEVGHFYGYMRTELKMKPRDMVTTIRHLGHYMDDLIYTNGGWAPNGFDRWMEILGIEGHSSW